MPLLKRKPYSLAETPEDLEPNELIFQVRFTKEIFTDYNEYLNKINLYRRRVWTCKVTGKTNLTYEEALVSEKRANEKVQQFPKEIVVPALRIIQYSMLSMRELAQTLAAKLQDNVFVGAELYARKDNNNNEYLCRVLKIMEEGDAVRYRVAWLDGDKKVVGNSTLDKKDLIQKKLPFTRDVWKSFIRESTYRNAPWVLHEKLAQKHGISTAIPEELRGKFFLQNGLVVAYNKKRKNIEDVGDQPSVEPIKYPIDDLLVQPGEDDPVFTDRPVPSRDFNVPMECVGDLLLIWDFCSSFGRLLHLSPYSLEDFENAICHKESNAVLLVETHAALLRLLMNDGTGKYLMAIRKRNRTCKITLITWTEYLCDMLEMIDIPELVSCTSTIKRGHYGLLDTCLKLGILRELIDQVVETCIFRETMDEFVEQRHLLGASKREEALEEGRKIREAKGQLKTEPDVNGVTNSECVENTSANGFHTKQYGNKVKKIKGEDSPSEHEQDDAQGKSESKKLDTSSKKMAKKLNVDVNTPTENGKDSIKKEPMKQLENGQKGAVKRNIQQRRMYYEREMEKRIIRTSPLGKDKDYNRYWWFRREERIFVESSDSKEWGYYSSKDELDALMGSLNCKGERECALKKHLDHLYVKISTQLQEKTKDLMHSMALEEAVVRRSTRVRAPPRENRANAFTRYVNKWKEE
ncbi:uncharacterized protein LOC115719475 [Cannabis sativa]|uniref:uncharacterized protein LOC115719475 n=1 Tax=Cannabis sativa TaxID=3483 RepID=UPI0029CA3E42|nr:uncharacterized protein LOC115719475 [Cannabis sativa]